MPFAYYQKLITSCLGLPFPFHNLKCNLNVTASVLIFFENFYGACHIFPVTSPVSNTFAYLAFAFTRTTPPAGTCSQLDFSIIFDR